MEMSINQKILIVDDRPENLFSLKQVLQDLGPAVEVISAEDGNQALIATLNHDFALALLDVQMPGMDGYELAEMMRAEERTSTLPIIFLSAVYSSDYHIFKGYDSGAVDFIVKPLSPPILLNKVGVFLQLAKQQQLLEEANANLTQMNTRLEEQVVRRTADLKTTVDQLKNEISRRKAAEKTIFRAQRMEAIGTLAGGIAHDFNNILASVIGFTELAIDEAEKGSQLEEYLEDVYTGGKRARDLVKQILAFSREREDILHPIQMSIPVKETLKLLKSSLPATIEIRQNIESGSLIMGDPTQVHQIIMNLCTNASYAMKKGGGILGLSLKDVVVDSEQQRTALGLEDGTYIALSVSDTGTGIAPEIIESIFDPYFSTKQLGDGTGLGLAQVHSIVKSYGGAIKVESAAGKGTTFIVYLPVDSDSEEQFEELTNDIPSGSERILLVDDEAPVLSTTKKNLESLGYSLTALTSSDEALAIFRDQPHIFDLVISDITMPDMTGDRLAAEIKAIRPGVPLILCTGYSEKISEEAAAEMGVAGYALKPLLKRDLAVLVRKVLDKYIGAVN